MREITQNVGSGVNTHLASTTDPDATIVRQGGGGPNIRHKTHRAVDERNEIITAVEVTTGIISEAHQMTTLIDAHTFNTNVELDTVVADSKYGTTDNLLACHDRGMSPHMPSLHAHS